MALLWILVIAGLVFLVHYLMRLRITASGREAALDIAKKRYASGEITKEQFEQYKRDLS